MIVDEFYVEQTLHGYSNGHRLLQASLKLSEQDSKKMMILSDLSGNEFVNGFERYFTGYNLDNNHKIALIHLSLNFLLTSLNFLNFPFQKSSLQFCVKGLSGDAEHFGGTRDIAVAFIHDLPDVIVLKIF